MNRGDDVSFKNLLNIAEGATYTEYPFTVVFPLLLMPSCTDGRWILRYMILIPLTTTVGVMCAVTSIVMFPFATTKEGSFIKLNS